MEKADCAGKDLMTEYSSLNLSEEGGIVHLCFNRPDSANCLDEVGHRELAEVIAALGARDDVRVLLMSAEGQSFSAGGDLDMIVTANQSKPMRERLEREGIAIFVGMRAMPYPIVCALQGAAIGLGATLVASADIVVGWRGAKIADPHVLLGLAAGDGGVPSWSQSIGINRAKRYLLTGDAITAAQAFDMGMVTDLVDTPEEALPVAEAIARRIAALPRDGVAGTKKAFAQLSTHYGGGSFELGLAYNVQALGSPEMLDRAQALSKPKPK